MEGVAITKKQQIKILLIWASVATGVLALFIFLVAGSALAYERVYADKMFPGVRVLNVRLDGLTKSEARQTVDAAVDAALAKGLRFTYHGKEVTLDTATDSSNPDTSRDLIRYSMDRAVDEAYELGRSGGWQTRYLTQSRLRIAPVSIHPDIQIDEAAIIDGLTTALDEDLAPTMDAMFAIDATSTPPRVSVVPEREGVELISDVALSELRAQAVVLNFQPISLSDRRTSPTIFASDLEPLIGKAEAFMRRPQIVFSYDSRTFPVPLRTLAGWVTVTSTGSDRDVAIDAFDFANDLKRIASGVEQEAKNGSLVIKDGKIESFVPGVQGLEIDVATTLAEVNAHWPASSTIPLTVRVTKATLLGEDPEKLGIKELLGVGRSNFSGSPTNRRKNIALGVARVNGSIIQPGATFSLIETLGPIDGEHKWLPELVIKGNETKPEFGGGLCQIGTTTFRAALQAGLPIVERRNHSYRVRYYEPAGTDATIYDPKPDFRFLNDTSHAILIHAYGKGDELYFEVWGTKDGRKAEQTKPVLYNFVPAPPMKLIETLELPPGKKKCTETAHAGVDASFTYTITYADGTEKKETFQSHYRPWQAVCLVGVEKLTESAPAPTDTPSIDEPVPLTP